MDSSQQRTPGVKEQQRDSNARARKDAEASRLSEEHAGVTIEPDHCTHDGRTVVEALATLHSLMLISDSALPLGSFAFSSGLESLLQHRRIQPKTTSLNYFLQNSLASVSRLALPFLRAAFLEPERLVELDNDFDACTPCAVTRRASIAQGSALLTLWERSFKDHTASNLAAEALSSLSASVKHTQGDELEVCAHFPTVYGAVAAAFGIDLTAATRCFLLSHAKTVLSAAVRAGVIGPFQAQSYLASSWMRKAIENQDLASRLSVLEGAGQVWVPGDLWLSRHELLYTRIFNS